MDWSDDELYAKARQRHTKGISRPVSDCEIIVGQETEIDMYREKIRYLEEKLRELEKPEPWGFGDLCKVNLNGEIVIFTVYAVNREISKDCVPKIEIKGTIIK